MQFLIVERRLVGIDQSEPARNVSSREAFGSFVKYAHLCALLRLQLLIHALDGSKRQRWGGEEAKEPRETIKHIG